MATLFGSSVESLWHSPLSYIEDGKLVSFILGSLATVMTPGWTNSPTIQIDSKLSENTISHVLPSAHMQVCMFHWLVLVVPQVLGK